MGRQTVTPRHFPYHALFILDNYPYPRSFQYFLLLFRDLFRTF